MKRFRHILKAATLLGLLGVQSLQAQTRLIVGTVTASKDGQNLANVSVTVVGTNINVFSDNEGRYAINAPASAKKLQFTLNGFQQVTIDIPTGSDKLDVKMESDEVGLNTVTITALGISRQQRALGYSSQNVSGAEIQG